MTKRRNAGQNRFGTADFPQTHGGIYICGINWGGSDDDDMAAIVRSASCFFSDDSCGRYAYRNRILKWFTLWDHPLERTASEASDFEYSITQTNWLDDRSKRSEHRTQPKYLLEHIDEFLSVCEARQPRVILLFGSCLGAALERGLKTTHRAKIEGVFGSLLKDPAEVAKNEEGETRFRVRLFSFEKCELVCLPHPTGAKGVTDRQMARYKPEIQNAFKQLPFTIKPAKKATPTRRPADQNRESY